MTKTGFSVVELANLTMRPNQLAMSEDRTEIFYHNTFDFQTPIGDKEAVMLYTRKRSEIMPTAERVTVNREQLITALQEMKGEIVTLNVLGDCPLIAVSRTKEVRDEVLIAPVIIDDEVNE